MTELINCARCGKQIQKKGPRIYCIKCRCEVDKEIAYKYRQKHLEEIREKTREYGRQKRAALKREE